MNIKKRYRGLKFNYKIGEKVLMDKYLTIEDFLTVKFPKNNNPLSPDLSTKVFNICWNGKYVSLNSNIDTLDDLIKFLSGDYYISNQDIGPKRIRSKQSSLERKGVYPIDYIRIITKDVLFTDDKRDLLIDVDGDMIKGNSQRYQTFFTKGCSCVKCGIEGKYFVKEKHRNASRYHLNLYAIDDDGNEVLMTKDHIIPRSKGGRNSIENYQTMCKICNEEKGNKMEEV